MFFGIFCLTLTEGYGFPLLHSDLVTFYRLPYLELAPFLLLSGCHLHLTFLVRKFFRNGRYVQTLTTFLLQISKSILIAGKSGLCVIFYLHKVLVKWDVIFVNFFVNVSCVLENNAHWLLFYATNSFHYVS